MLNRLILPILCSGFCSVWLLQEPAAADNFESDLNKAIDNGIDFLLKEVEKKQSDGDPRNGRIALETYALIVAGVSVDHPAIKKNFEILHRMPLDHIYTVACYVFLLDAAINQVQSDQIYLTGKEAPEGGAAVGGIYTERLEKAITAIIRMKLNNKGAWHYGPDPKAFDYSNSQFAILALGAGAKRKIDISPTVWEEIAKQFITTQQTEGPEVMDRLERHPKDDQGDGKNLKIKLVDKEKDKPGDEGKKDEKAGSKSKTETRKKTTLEDKAVPEIGDENLKVFSRGWNYTGNPKEGPSWNMTCAGLSSAVLAAQNLKGRVPMDFLNQLNKSIRDGYGWVMQNWNIAGGGGEWKYYGLYSVEKVADLNEIKKFGVHDWYDEVARHLIGAQNQATGAWEGNNASKMRENTSFALLVLNRATTMLLETRKRSLAERILSTGPVKTAEKVADDWVYIQSLDRELHIPSVFRLLRLRPHPKVVSFINSIVDNYPLGKKALLIPHLMRAYKDTPHKSVQKFLKDHLDEITGASYDNIESYSKWLRRWQDVEEIGTAIKKAEIPMLIKYYQHTQKSWPLREKVIWALTRCQAREAASMFVSDLSHSEANIRTAAYSGLQSLPLSEPLPPFSARASSDDRSRQLKTIEAWFKRVQ